MNYNLDNNIQFPGTSDEQVDHAGKVMTSIHDAAGHLLWKVRYSTDRLDFLGDGLCPRRLKLSTLTIDAIRVL